MENLIDVVEVKQQSREGGEVLRKAERGQQRRQTLAWNFVEVFRKKPIIGFL